MVSNSGIQPTDFTDRLFAVGMHDNNWHSAQVDLASYVGESIYVAFRSSGRRGSVIRVDDVSGPDVWRPETDLELRAVVSPGRYVSPEDSVQPRIRIRNRGTLPASGAVTEYSAIDSATGQRVYQSAAAAPTVEPGDSVVVTMPDVWCITAGTYRTASVCRLPGDEHVLNDTVLGRTTASWTKELSYDDGIPTNRLAWNYPGKRHGVRFTPAHYPALLTQVKCGMHPYWSPNRPGSDTFKVVVVDDNGALRIPGMMICSTRRAAGRPGAWNPIDLSSRQVQVDSGSIYVFIEQTGTGGYSPVWNLDHHDDAPESTQWVMEGNNQYYPKRRSGTPIQNGDFLLRAVFTEIRRDVGVTELLSVPDTLQEGNVFTPRAIVRNLGDTRTGRFPVVFRIGSQYTSTVTADSLDPGETATLTFADWAAVRGHQAVSCSTALHGDIRPGNDVMRDTMRVYYHDYGIASIISPGEIVGPGLISPGVVVCNYGNVYDRAWIVLTIRRDTQLVYHDSLFLDVHPGDFDSIIFHPWFPGSGSSYRLVVYTALFGDMNRSNDTARRDFRIVDHDVGVAAIVEPVDTIRPESVATPRAQVRNYGGTAETFQVTCELRSRDSTLQRDSVERSLAAGAETSVEFNAWSGPVGDYRVRCFTSLAGDGNPGNDSCERDFAVAVRDASVTGIIAPAGMVARDDSVHPAVRICNCGTWNQTIPVHVVIDPGYEESLWVQVAPGETSLAVLPTWRADSVGDYYLRAWTALTVDLDRSNDTARGSIRVYYRDVAMAGIRVPAESVGWDSCLVPVVLVRNLGSEQETLRVRFDIGTDTSLLHCDSLDCTIAAGDSALLSFAPWPMAPGRFTARTAIVLAGDRNPENDSAVLSFVVLLTDAGATSIRRPQGIVEPESTVVPCAVFRNFGTSAITGQACCVIDPGGYRDSAVLNLAAGESLAVGFAAWSPDTIGDYVACAFTQIAGDQRPGNDTVRSYFQVRQRLPRDIAVTQILEPRDSIRADSSVAPRAVAWNYGQQPEEFRLEFRIDAGYAETLRVQLAPNESLIAGSFRRWTPGQAGDYSLSCRAVLEGDFDSTNNEARAMLRVIPARMRDMGVVDILEPRGSIDTGAIVIPRVLLRNFGNVSVSSPVTLRIPDISYGSTRELRDLPAGQDAVLDFAAWTARGIGTHVARCSLWAVDDNRANDTLQVAFSVQLPSPWRRMANLPTGPRRRDVRAGAVMSADEAGSIYALKGNRTREFYRYNTTGGVWDAACSIPGPSPVRRGAAVCRVPGRDEFYVIKGGGRTEFWRYDSTGNWLRRADVPVPVRPGATLTALDTGPVYLARGGSREFFRYDPVLDTWTVCAPVLGARGCKDGSALVAVRDYLYLLKGLDNEFFAYSTSEDTWYKRLQLPFFGPAGRRRRAKAGTAITHDHDAIFVMKGGSSGELWWYDTFGDTWEPEAPLPTGASGRAVAEGGALVWAADRLWALKGNRTNEFWAYVPPTRKRRSATATAVQGPPDAFRLGYRLDVTPNPLTRTGAVRFSLPRAGFVTLTLHDVAGRTRQVLHSGRVDAGRHQRRLPNGLASGVYFLELRSAEMVVRCKVVKKNV